jgi:hypothetical protein
LAAGYDFGQPDVEQEVSGIDDHRWNGKTLKFQVQWTDGGTTWELLRTVDNCAALDDYLALKGVKEPSEPPKEDRRRAKHQKS